jgi:prepilin-type N-terminal cleavage/methylation domain-containing protein
MAGQRDHARAGAGFTLLELLVVLLIVLVTIAFLFPVFRQVREKGRQTICLSQVSQHARAVLMYTQDYDERLPVARNQFGLTAAWDESLYPRWWNVIDPYLKSHQVFRCPDDAGYLGMREGDPFNNKPFFPETGSSYSSFIGWLPTSDQSLDSRLPRLPGGLGGLPLASVIDPTRAAVSYDSWPYWHAAVRDLRLALASDELELNVSFLDGSARRRSSRSLTTYLVQGPTGDNGPHLALGDLPASNPSEPARISATDGTLLPELTEASSHSGSGRKAHPGSHPPPTDMPQLDEGIGLPADGGPTTAGSPPQSMDH